MSSRVRGLSTSAFADGAGRSTTRPKGTPVPTDQLHAEIGSPTARWAISAEMSVMAKPAYAHSLSRAGTMGMSSAATPAHLAHESSMRK